MKITDFKNEDALDLLVDLVEPTARIFADAELREAVQKGVNKITALKIAIRNNKASVIEILARLNNTPVEEYQCTLPSIIKDMLDILNDEELASFFTSQQLIEGKKSSTKPMENTKAKEK